MKRLLVTAVLGAMATCGLAADTTSVKIDLGNPLHPVSPTLYGIFFEEINRAGDGGIYAEMLENRSFEDAAQPVAWNFDDSDPDAKMSLDTSKPLNDKNPTALKISSPRAGASVSNDGFHGLAVTEGEEYDLSLYIRAGENFNGNITAAIVYGDKKIIAKQTIDGITSDWKQFKVTFKANITDTKARLVLTSNSGGDVYLDMVSLFPKKTWKNRPNGLRADLMQMIDDMKPAFVRFPGGCFVEGDRIENAFRWKNSIGDIAVRPGHWNLWNYRSTDGLGYLEYLQMCRDLKAEPMHVVNVGMAHKNHIPMDKMDEFVQDAVDSLEYANGGVDTKWGKLRAEQGSPEPFNMKRMEVGNENGGPLYNERYALFVDALRQASPDIHLVACLWGGLPSSRPVEIVDEHYYHDPNFFFQRADLYDTYDRNSHKVYVGEYAVTEGCGNGNLIAALGEAAYMTGMERNSDVVVMASYAPLLVNPPYKKWNPNAIVYNNHQVYGTPSYYVQALFSQNRADVVVPVDITQTIAEAESRPGMIGVGTWATSAEYKDIKVTKNGKTLYQSDFSKGLDGWKKAGGDWKIVNGALRQDSLDENQRIFIGDLSWTDYTLELKARKISGAEGFLISFQAQNTQDKSFWNIGGWGNTGSAIESEGVSDRRVDAKVESDKWYDIKVELKGAKIKCFLDGKLVQEVGRGASKKIFATAGTRGDKEVLVKLVNNSSEPSPIIINLASAGKLEPTGTAIVLGGNNPNLENSFAEPTKVTPKTSKVTGVDDKFNYTLSPYSVTVLQLKKK